jgi:outer membrane immunogenic protein
MGTLRNFFMGCHMNRLFLMTATAASVAALATTANAADMAPAPSVYDWTGAYIGLNAGIAWGNSEVNGRIGCIDNGIDTIAVIDRCALLEDGEDFSFSDLGVGDDDGTAFTGGAMIGYNWQMDSLVLGVEADVNYAGFGSSSNRDLSDWANDRFDTVEPISASHRAEFDADWWGTLRGRIGFAHDNLLFYGTGGLAWGHMEASSRLDACWDGCDEPGEELRYGGSASDTNFGWTLGAGMEAGFDSWTLGIEYLYVDLGSSSWNYNGDFGDALDDPVFEDVEFPGRGNVDYQFSVVRATAKWRF